MNCEKCRERFPDYVGEELNPEWAEEFREHVASCAALPAGTGPVG